MQRFSKIRRLHVEKSLAQAADSAVFRIIQISTNLQALTILPGSDTRISNRIKWKCMPNLMSLIDIHSKSLKALRVDLTRRNKYLFMEYINLWQNAYTHADLGVIHLPNAELVQWIGNAKNSFLPIVISSIREILDLECVNIDEAWNDRIIKYQTFENTHSLSNIKSLILNNVQLPHSKSSINKIAKLFCGIKYLELGLINNDMLNLLKSKEMKSTLITNDTKIFIAESGISVLKYSCCDSKSMNNDNYDPKNNIVNVFKCLRDNGIKYHHYNDVIYSIPRLLHQRLVFSFDAIQTLHFSCIKPKIFSWIVEHVFCNSNQQKININSISAIGMVDYN